MELFYPTNSLLALYLFIAVLLTDAASDFKWSVCDSTSYFEVKNVTMNPLPAKPGGRLETIIEGDVLQPLQSGGKIQISFPLYSISVDYCDSSQGRYCPVEEGPVRVPFDLTLPRAASIFAGRSVNGQVKLIDAQGTERLCLKVAVPIQGRRSGPANWIEEMDMLESLLPDELKLQLLSPLELHRFSDWAIENKETEDFSSLFIKRAIDLLQLATDGGLKSILEKFDV